MAGKRRAWATRIGIGVSIIFLYLFLKGIEYRATWEALQQVNYGWLIPVFLAAYGSLITRAYRWRVFLGAEHPHIKISRLFNTLTIGFFGNAVFPARAGEFLRSYMLSRQEQVRFTEAFATVVVERVFDMFALVLSIVLVFSLAIFPPELKDSNPDFFRTLQKGSIIIAIATAGLTFFMCTMVRMPRQCHQILLKLTFFLPKGIQDKLLSALESFVLGLGIFKDLKATFLALFWTALVWFCILLTEYFLILAFNFNVSLLQTMILMVTLAFAVALPQGPGYLGPFQWASKETLVRFFGVPAAPATAFAILLWFAQQMPIIIIGLICLHLEGLTLGQLWRSAKVQEKK